MIEGGVPKGCRDTAAILLDRQACMRLFKYIYIFLMWIRLVSCPEKSARPWIELTESGYIRSLFYQWCAHIHRVVICRMRVEQYVCVNRSASLSQLSWDKQKSQELAKATLSAKSYDPEVRQHFQVPGVGSVPGLQRTYLWAKNFNGFDQVIQTIV